ncbi:V-set and immunoglobulin domain-containing protein 10-like isoform X1 [Paroedura picta]|uniref:V-set and immunoglobulin domain-containing protein 10-like isoform X1 n=2 Tax=Paroedura picta TaxID=143630 RepID=UPI004057A164
MAHCWHRRTCLSTTFTGWLLALLVPLAPVLSSTPQDGLVGNSTFLAISFPLPPPGTSSSIAWKKDETYVATGSFKPNFTVQVTPECRHRFAVDPMSGSLNITELRLSDAGSYTVSLIVLGGSGLKANITLRVYELVTKVSVDPPSAEKNEGDDSVTLTCSPVQGSVTWTKDGQALGEDPRLQLSGGSLQIHHLQHTDSGTYRCTVSNPFSNGTGTTQLTVYYGPETPIITVSSLGQDPEAEGFVLVNASVNLTCQAPSLPPADIYWNVPDSEDSQVPSSPTLPLPSVQLNQAGTYACLAINRRTQRNVRSTYSLTVAQRPSGPPQCSVSSINNGSALRFACDWPGGSPEPCLTFLGLPVDVEATSSHLEQQVDPPFPAGLSGQNVTCLASHLTEERSCSIIPEAPSGVFLSFQASKDPGGTVTVEMRCRGTFNPAEIDWLRDGLPLVPAGDRFVFSPDGTGLTIRNFSLANDLGNYSTHCSNPLGSQSANLTLIGPTVSESTLSRGPDPGSAYLVWTVPTGAVTTGFQIQWQGPQQGRSASEWETMKELGGANRSATVSGLDPRSSYSFQVVPFLGSQPGKPSQVLTLQAEPYLSAGAIAGIVIGAIFGFLLILLLVILLVLFACRARRRKVPPTPTENQQHYLSRQFPHGRESKEPSWGNPRWSAGDSDIYAITYEEHLRRYGGPANLDNSEPHLETGNHRNGAHRPAFCFRYVDPRDSGSCEPTAPPLQATPKSTRSATQV